MRKLDNLVFFQQVNHLSSVVTSLHIMKHTKTKLFLTKITPKPNVIFKKQDLGRKKINAGVRLICSVYLRPGDGGLKSGLDCSVAWRQGFNNVNIIFQNFNEVPPIENVPKITA